MYKISRDITLTGLRRAHFCPRCHFFVSDIKLSYCDVTINVDSFLADIQKVPPFRKSCLYTE